MLQHVEFGEEHGCPEVEFFENDRSTHAVWRDRTEFYSGNPERMVHAEFRNDRGEPICREWYEGECGEERVSEREWLVATPPPRPRPPETVITD